MVVDSPLTKSVVRSEAYNEELTLELGEIAEQWQLEKCIFIDPISQVDGDSITLFDLIEAIIPKNNLKSNPFAKPWPFQVEDFLLDPANALSSRWSLNPTQHTNVLQLSNGLESFILVIFQDISSHFSALLPMVLLSVKKNILCICMPGWPRRLSHWNGEFLKKLSSIFPEPIDSPNARRDLELSLSRKAHIILDTSFPVNHPGNFWMNDIGPASALYDLTQGYRDRLELVRLSTGWVDDKDSSYLITGKSQSVCNLKYFETRQAITNYAASRSSGLIAIWGASVSSVLSKRCRWLVISKYNTSIEASRPGEVVIGVGLRVHDRVLLNLDECLKAIVSRFDANKRQLLRFIFHGSTDNQRYLPGKRYIDKEVRQARHLAEVLAETGVNSNICVGLSLFDQLCMLSNACIDISPLGTTQLKSLFMLDIPMIVHSPTGRQPFLHSGNPWHTNGDLSYTSIYRGEPHSASIFTTKEMVSNLVPPPGCTNPIRYNYSIDPLQLASLFIGFYKGLAGTDH